MARPLAPFAKQYLELQTPPAAGLWIATGPAAWRLAASKSFPVLVLPRENEPRDFRWPAHPGGALVLETGASNENRLTALAAELLAAGTPFVVAIREALRGTAEQTLFFYPKLVDAA